MLIPQQEAEQKAAAARAAIAAAVGTNDQAVLSIVYPTAAGPLRVVYRSLSVTNGTAAGQQALAAAAAAREATGAVADVGRRLLAAAAAAAAAAPLARNATAFNSIAELANHLTVCAGSMQGLELVGSNVCIVSSDDLPLPPDYTWYDPFYSSSSSSGASSWPVWQAAVVALAVALPVLAAVTFLSVTVRRRKRQKLLQFMQQQLPAKDGPSNSSSSATGCYPGVNSSSSGNAAAASSKEQLLPCAASAQGSNLQQQQQQQQQSQWQQQWQNPALAKLSAGAASRNSIVVNMGAQITSQAGTTAPAGASMLFAQQQRAAGGANQQQRLAGAISIVSAGLQARRLAGGGAGVGFSSSSRSGVNPDPAAAAAGGGTVGVARKASPGSPSAAAAPAASKQQLQQRMVRLSIDEDQATGDEQQQQQLGDGEVAAAADGLQHDHQGPVVAMPNSAVVLSSSPHNAASIGNALQSRQPASTAAAKAAAAAQQQLQLHEPIGQGTFGVVFRATWRGIPAAVKLLQLPAAVGESLESAGLAAAAGAGGVRGSSSREQMAIMEAAVGASINHPNVVQVRLGVAIL
jgi:hypothetical protein